jgi:hypothetical protein
MVDEITLAQVNRNFAIWRCLLENFNRDNHFVLFFYLDGDSKKLNFLLVFKSQKY